MLFAIDNKLPIAIFLIVSGVLPSASEGSIGIVAPRYLYIAGVAVVNQRYVPSTKPLPVTGPSLPPYRLDLAFIFVQVNDYVLRNERCLASLLIKTACSRIRYFINDESIIAISLLNLCVVMPE